MTTVDTMAKRIISRMNGNRRQTLLTLGAAISSAGATSFTLSATAPTGLVEGSVVEIGAELMHVTSVSGVTVNVIRGHRGSTAATHSNGATVTVEPTFFQSEIQQMMLEEVLSWNPYLFRTVSAEVSFGSTDPVVTLSGSPITLDVYEVLSATVEPDLTGEPWLPVQVSLIRDADFTSGYGLTLRRPIFGETKIIHVVYATGFDTTTWASSTDLQSTVGLKASMEDLLVVGTMYRSVLDDEVVRTSLIAQGQPRLAAEVPPTHRMQASDALAQARERMLHREARALRRTYSMRGT